MFPTAAPPSAARLVESSFKGAMPNSIGDCSDSPAAPVFDSVLGVGLFGPGHWPLALGANQLNWHAARASSTPARWKARREDKLFLRKCYSRARVGPFEPVPCQAVLTYGRLLIGMSPLPPHDTAPLLVV